MPQADSADSSDGWTTVQRLALEVRDVESAIELVRSGAASRVTLTGLRFAEQVLGRLDAEARRDGIALDPLYWPEDAGCDVTVRRTDVEA